MSWQQPNPQDYEKLAELTATEGTNHQFYRLLKVLSPALRIEPLLLRNARLQFVPESDTELESQLWFSSFIQSRNAKAAIMHKGIASVLMEELEKDEQEQQHVIQFIRNQTRHWSAQDRLEQKMRWAVRKKNADELKQDFRQILATLVKLKDDSRQQKDFVRWLRGAMPNLTTADKELSEEAQLIYQAIATSINSPEKWHPQSSQNNTPIPTWLREALPLSNETEMGVQLRPGLLEIVNPETGKHIFSTHMPMPTQIYLKLENDEESRWEPVWFGKKIKLPLTAKSIGIQTLEGKNWLLEIVQESSNENETLTASQTEQSNAHDHEIYMAIVEEDLERSKPIIQWFEDHGISVKAFTHSSDRDTRFIQPDGTNPQKVIRLWSSAAQKHWGALEAEVEPHLKSIILRIEDIPLPSGSSQIDQLIDWKDLQDNTKNQAILDLLTQWSIETPTEIPESTAEHDATATAELYTEADELIAELNNINTNPRRRLEIGDRLAEIGDPRPGVGTREIEIIEYSPEVQKLLDELDDINTQPPRRLEIGNLLDEMGDPRIGVGLDENGLPEIDWVEIPAGEFIYGEVPHHDGTSSYDGTTTYGGNNLQTLDTFFISRYTITNKQFQAFIDDNGYEDEHWWQDLKKPEPVNSRWQQANRPRETIDWYEAVAYTRWLSSKLGYEITLPTEQQWEKAARGADGRNYPWGNEYLSGYANVDEKENKDGEWYLEETTAAGVYPHGKSPYEVQDLSGNVWEWCLNKLDSPEVIKADTSGDSRVLRGGSWLYNPALARAVRRFGNYPFSRNSYYGFRVVCVLPFTDH